MFSCFLWKTWESGNPQPVVPFDLIATEPLDQSFAESFVFEETNKQREAEGLKPLTLSHQLTKAAQRHAQNMSDLNKLSHELNIKGESNLESRLENVEYNYRSCGENIAWNYELNKVVDGWMKSKGHRKNILGDFDEIGIGVRTNERGEPYYCQVFGKK